MNLRLPLLHDHHNHPSLYAAFLACPNLRGLGPAQARALLAGLPDDRLSLVTGWRSDLLDPADFALEDAPPVIVVNSSLHGYAWSPAALPYIGAQWPEFAEHIEDRAWGERRLPDLFAFYGRVAGLDQARLDRFMRGLEDVGIRSTEDLTVTGKEALDVFRASPYAARLSAWCSPGIYRALGPEDRRYCRGIKLFLDGSLGARSAALDAPFADGSKGALCYTDGELLDLISGFAGGHAALSVHAIGHCAIEQAIGAVGRLDAAGLRFRAVRLEHVQFISETQARRARDLGLVLSMQPNFSADSADYADRLSPRHRAENNPFRMLMDAAGFRPGIDLVFGSDGMPHGMSEALRCALFPLESGQALTVDELVAGYGGAPGWRELSRAGGAAPGQAGMGGAAPAKEAPGPELRDYVVDSVRRTVTIEPARG